jgi:CubicO group peptidase (beta-lactamase class C family)
MKRLLVCLGLLCATACANSRTGTLDHTLTHIIERENIPGAHYLVVDADGVRVDVRVGLRDAMGSKPPAPKDLWMVGSITKAVTAVATLQLVEHGQISLDDPLSLHFPEHPYGDELTIRQLLTHTAGVPNPAPLKWFFIEGEEFDRAAQLEALFVDNPTLASPPGRRWAYSNLGYWLLEVMIERVTGVDYADHIRAAVFAPLGVDGEDVLFDRVPDARAVRGHSSRWSATNLVFFTLSSSAYWVDPAKGFSRHARIRHWGRAYGGLSTTAAALGALLSDLLKDEPRVLRPASVQLLFAAQSTTEGPLEHGLGWVIGQAGGHPYLGKQGGALGFHGNIRVYPERGIATVWLANRTEVTTKPIDAISDELDRFALEATR